MPVAVTTPSINPDWHRDETARMLATIAVEAGGVLDCFRSGECGSMLKADGSPVSEADIAAERLIHDRLSAAFPAVPIVSEEQAASHSTVPWPAFFLVDPLDGTRPFLAGKPDFCVLIALIVAGKPIAGAIHAPALGRSWWAGERAYAAHGPGLADASELLPKPAGTAIAIVSRDSAGDASRGLCAELGARQILSENSALKFARLADGEADIYPRRGQTMQWDIAAGDALLRALGGGIFDLDGNPLVYGAGALGWANPHFIAYRRRAAPA
jgi:3'(2'),5'-bisphosphate nucleotidase